MTMTSVEYERGGVIASDYLDLLLSQLERAQYHVRASMFYVDLRIHRDPERYVLSIADALEAASRRGVDVRVLIGGVTQTQDILVANLASARYLREVGVPVRGFRSDSRYLTHEKTIVMDNVSLVGSHNWEHSAFTEYRETSVWVRSEEVASDLIRRFDRQWETSLEVQP